MQKSTGSVANSAANMSRLTENWPFKINLDKNFLQRAFKKPRVAFMSSSSRTYFPADPGHTRFGISYAMHRAPGDVPNPMYFPPVDSLNKPISNKGYGIGGLNGARLAKLVCEKNPAPNAYQEEVAPRQHRRVYKSKSQKRSPAISPDKIKDPRSSTLPRLSAVIEARVVDVRKKTNTNVVKPLAQPSFPLNPYREKLLENRRKRNMCLQTWMGFGSSLGIERFGTVPTFNTVGVGYYDLKKTPKELAKHNTFHSKPVTLILPTVTNCNYHEYDRCYMCGLVLKTADYYRSKNKLRCPKERNLDVERKDRPWTVTSIDDEAALEAQKVCLGGRASTYISLCRSCYCKGVRGNNKYWNRTTLHYLFRKTRHCAYIHEHRNVPEFYHKTSCKLVNKLSTLEAMMAKYYTDGCPKVYKQL